MIVEAVMMEGCPHCNDSEPKIVAWHRWEPTDNVQFIGDAWSNELIEAVGVYGQLRIISCRPITGENDAN